MPLPFFRKRRREAPASEAPAAPPAPAPDRPGTVVIADDTEALRTLVKRELEPEFEIVGEAVDGAAVVGIVGEAKPDFVLLDLNMPRRDGLQAIPDIRAASPDTTIVVLTGLAPELIADKCEELGAHVFFEKSTPLQELPGTLRRWRAGER
jgi:CheY-like chemotaxis protein